MISYTKRYVNIVSLLITIFLYILLTWTYNFFETKNLSPFSISKYFKRSLVIVELTSDNINQETKDNN